MGILLIIVVLVGAVMKIVDWFWLRRGARDYDRRHQ